MEKVRVRNLNKIYGPNPRKALELVRQGISKDDLLKKTGNGIGLSQVSFEVNSGEIFVVMGLSGSGKSTLIRCLNRLVEPTEGEILIDGYDVCKADAHTLLEIRRKKMNMVFQNFALLPHRTVLENVSFGLEVQNADMRTREKAAQEALEMVGLCGYESSFPKELSGGMQQRVGLARALATNADILLMDEAFSALDPLIRTEMQDELMALQETMQKTIIFITHDLDEALKIGDRIAIMKEGKVIQIGSPEEILEHPADQYVRAFIKDVNRAKVLSASSVMKKPVTAVLGKDGIMVAVRKMEEEKISSIFVVNKEKKLYGIVTVDRAMDALKRGEKDILPLVEKDVEKARPDTPLIDLLTVAAHAKYPIAVLNDGGILLGIIARVSVLAGLAGEELHYD